MEATRQILSGDCLEVLKTLPASSLDACVTDPPYLLAFMGKDWDRVSVASAQAWHEQWAREVLRVLKPGAHILAFGGTRTFHRMACAFEDAGFEMRDTLMWLYGSGFPKSLNISKAIDREAGAEREVIGRRTDGPSSYMKEQKIAAGTNPGKFASGGGKEYDVTAPATEEAKRWEGWGTNLKPSYEPIILARKPLGEDTIAKNVVKHGTGGINIEGCRIETSDNLNGGAYAGGEHPYSPTPFAPKKRLSPESYQQPTGRWPANVVLDEEAAALLDQQTGDLGISSGGGGEKVRGVGNGTIYGTYGPRSTPPNVGLGDSGGASRFFYTAKASRSERNSGHSDNIHPTVKTIDLMRWLVRLVTPVGGTVLDPFLGSGTTAIACKIEGLSCIGIEREAEYIKIVEQRITALTQTSLFGLVDSEIL